MLYTYLRRSFRTNYRKFRYRRLQHNVFGETLLSGTNSKNGNKYAKVFVTNFGWSRAFPMAKKEDAYEALYLLFKQDGVPPKMIVDGPKE